MAMIVPSPISLLASVKPHSLAVCTGGGMAPEGRALTAARAVVHLAAGELAITQGRADLAPGLPTSSSVWDLAVLLTGCSPLSPDCQKKWSSIWLASKPIQSQFLHLVYSWKDELDVLNLE